MSDKRPTSSTPAKPAAPKAASARPPRETFPLAIGETDHLESQIVAHHARDDAAPAAEER